MPSQANGLINAGGSGKQSLLYIGESSLANGENIGRLMCVNFTNALLLSNKNEKLHKTLIYLEFDSKLEGGTRTKWMKMILEGYRLLEGRGIV